MTDQEDIRREERYTISVSERLLWVLVLSAPIVLLGGWVLSTMWGWFVVPLGAPAVGVLHGVGLYLMVRTVVTRNQEASKRHPLGQAFVGAGTLLVMLGLCALVKWGMPS